MQSGVGPEGPLASLSGPPPVWGRPEALVSSQDLLRFLQEVPGPRCPCGEPGPLVAEVDAEAEAAAVLSLQHQMAGGV